MRRADRLFQIIQFLRTRRITTARWLAERLEVSERTIYRDIKDLTISGVDIDGEAGIGYIIRKGFDFPPLMFSVEEIKALTLGARIVESWADQSLATAAQSALSKIESALPEQKRREVNRTLLFSPMSRISADISNIMLEIRLATDRRQKIIIHYQKADGEQSQRTLWPLGLFFWGNTWTFGAWCELRNDFRIFRLDRINQLELSEDQYPIEPGKTLDDLIRLQDKACEN